MNTVAVVCFDGFDELDAIGPYEVFENAARAGADWDVTLRSAHGEPTVTASHGLTVEADGPLAAVSPDLLVVPGGGWTDTDRCSNLPLRADPGVGVCRK